MAFLNLDESIAYIVALPYPAVVVRRRSLHDGADEEGLVTVELLLTSYDTEAQTPRCAPAQHDVLTAVQVSAGDKRLTLSHPITPSAHQISSIRPNTSFSMSPVVKPLTFQKKHLCFLLKVTATLIHSRKSLSLQFYTQNCSTWNVSLYTT